LLFGQAGLLNVNSESLYSQTLLKKYNFLKKKV